MRHLLAILGLMALCAGWVLFQQWLRRVDPDRGGDEKRCIGCGSGGCKTREPDGEGGAAHG